MGKLILGTATFMIGVFLCFTVVGAIPGTVMIFTGGAMMYAGVFSVGKSTVKTGIAAGKALREMNRDGSVADAPLQVASSAPSVADEIRRLGDLLSDGLLTKEEFERKKSQLLAS